jgi:hypothetical protein
VRLLKERSKPTQQRHLPDPCAADRGEVADIEAKTRAVKHRRAVGEKDAAVLLLLEEGAD